MLFKSNLNKTVFQKDVSKYSFPSYCKASLFSGDCRVFSKKTHYTLVRMVNFKYKFLLKEQNLIL